MEKHRCKLCLKSFANGRALGGHMRSHMLNLYVPPKIEQPSDQLGEETESASSSSSSEEEKELGYGLRENPKKSIRLVDPEFSFAIDAGSVVLQDRESETESSKNPIQRRSKRIRKSGITEHHQYHDQRLKEPEVKKIKLGKTESSSWVEPEPVSSISDTIPEEDVAYCLMMLSRDKWMREEHEHEPEPEIQIQLEAEQEEAKKYMVDQSDESDELKYSKARVVRGKYKCETCKKVFRSYQALGGHRASHKKIKLNNNGISNSNSTTKEPSGVEKRNAGTSEEKIHECPVCYRVFSSGQALGGHKRSHVLGQPPTPPAKPPAKFGETMIDLNLPAPIDDDDISQIELSAVSDAEFVNPLNQ
uniref:Putative zinc finger protein ZAT4-like n=1 Tax=Davidia involucrata TaxID=16924 RepID=A0A5B7A956_DAVIN